MDILPPPKRPTPQNQPVSPTRELNNSPRQVLNNSEAAQSPAPAPTPIIQSAPPSLPNLPDPSSAPEARPVPKSLRRPLYRKWQVWALLLLGLVALFSIGLILWYNWALRPIDSSDLQSVRVVIESGQTSRDIVDTLFEKGLVRSGLATQLYIDMSGQKSSLQAGGYVLSKSMSVPDIVAHIAEGKADELSITILPGLTLKDLADAGVKGSLAQQGFSPEEIKAAFDASYDSPVLADRPQGQGLEGYLFPETYRMNAGDNLNAIVQKALDEFHMRLQTEGLIEKFKARNLNLHQAVTLSSIVGKEVGDPTIQRQVAQVFYKRLADGMVLGSDVTFEYAAAQLGVTPAVDIASPYNTRQVTGLPPGPIANMNMSALQAVADPAPGDYVYFVAGDNGNTYFGRTFEEHEANIAAHCIQLCNLY